jgi:hypothetical protein
VTDVLLNFIHGDVELWQDVADPQGVDISLDDLAPRIRMGREIWIIQAFQLLRRRGYNVQLSGQARNDAVNIVHRDDLRHAGNPLQNFLVTVRADRDPAFVSHFEIVQNRWSVWSATDIYVPHWPQPGLIPRVADRGSRIENVVYCGKAENLARELRSDEFAAALRDRGMTLHIRSDDWWNYEDTDVVLAVRAGEPFYLDIKPASKLVNAWLAGCPAILSREAGYTELREGPLDYLEARSVEDVLGALDRLRSQQTLFDDMVANGRRRAADHAQDAVLASWETALRTRIIPGFVEWRSRNSAGMGRSVRHAVHVVRRRLWGTQAVQFEKGPVHSAFYRLRRGLILRKAW